MAGAAYDLTIHEAAAAMRAGTLTATALTESVLGRIEATEPTLNAYLTVTADAAREEAARADAELAAGRDRGPLHGIPFALKDLIDTAGVRTTGGSGYLRDRIPQDDATVVKRLREAGVVLTGKLGLFKYFGSTSVTPPFGAIHNPWNPAHEPGSSSGGSGAAVSAGSCLGSLGSDTGGSIRTPASFSGVVGLKPTYGRVSRAGALPLAWTADHLGPLARSVEDAALILNVIAGYDAADPMSSQEPVDDYTSGLGGDLRGLRIGVARDPFWAGCQASVVEACEAALEVLQDAGAEVREVTLPQISSAGELQSLRAVEAEASAYYIDLIGEDPDDLPEALKQGMSVRAVDYLNDQRRRRVLVEELERTFREVDVLISPTSPATAPSGVPVEDTDRVRGELGRFVVAFAVLGNPAISLPCGFDEQGLPIGLQMAGGYFDEATLLRVAHAYEQATDWHRRRPPL